MAKKPVDNMSNTDETIDNVQTPETEFEKNSTRQNEQVERDNAKTELEKVGEAMGINPDDMTQEEKDILAHIFEKRRLHPATKEQKEKLYKNEEKIVSSGEKVKTVKDKRKDEYNLLVLASRSMPQKKILYGTIDGMCEDDKVGYCMTASLDDTDGQFIIKIPANEFFELKPEDYEISAEGVKHFRSELSSRIGSHVGFTVYSPDENAGYTYASRIDAMEMIAKRNYIDKQKDGAPEIVNGCLVKAVVVASARDRVKVDVMGAEATILSKELSHTALGPINTEPDYAVGQSFIVKVSDIKKVTYEANNKTHTLIHLNASKRQAEPDPSTMYYDQFQIGDRCFGVIKNITPTGVFVNLKNKMDCVCKIPPTGTPAIGKTCIVDIYNKKDEERWLYGNIIHIN